MKFKKSIMLKFGYAQNTFSFKYNNILYYFFLITLEVKTNFGSRHHHTYNFIPNDEIFKYVLENL